jgi:trehalose-phosphatase
MGRLDSEEAVEARMRCPVHLWSAWEAIRRRIGQPERLVLLADFDGTLARIRRHPEHAHLPNEVRSLLAAISAHGALVGVISGRSLDDIRERVELPGIWYVGTHGFSLCTPAGRVMHLATAAQKRQVVRVAAHLDRRLRALKGVRVERKDHSVAVHYRNASPTRAREAIQAVREADRRAPRLRLLTGKKIVELLPGVGASKWSAVEHILRQDRARQRARPQRRLTFYLGDDSTDEAVFTRLAGISIAVGKSCQTNARYFLKSPAEVRRFLRLLLEELA